MQETTAENSTALNADPQSFARFDLKHNHGSGSEMRDPRSSMLYWYPKIKDLPIPQPRTEILESQAPQEAWYAFLEGASAPINIEDLKETCRRMGYPLFLRTDQASAKHHWKDTCYVSAESRLEANLYRLIDLNLAADIIGLTIRALVVREYIPMLNLFTAFYGDMPVNPEIRCFIREGLIQCYHWYWIEDATVNPSVPNWREILDNYRSENFATDLLAVRKFARIVVDKFKDDGFWSVDFCKSKAGQWILIDMAEGERSWHPECRFKGEGK